MQAQAPATNEILFIDLVPRSAWFSNLRSELTPDEWQQIKKKTYKASGYRCQACGGKGTQWPVEAHERWAFDEQTGIQRLLKTIALCPACHQVTHYGFAQVQGRAAEAEAHLMRVNRWTQAQVNEHIDYSFKKWERRSMRQWKLDMRWILGFVEISDATRQKIERHAAGFGKRNITHAETQIVSGTHINHAQINSVSDVIRHIFFHGQY